MPFMRRKLLLLLLALAWPAHAAGPTGSHRVESLVLLKEGNIRACGVRAKVSNDQAARTFELLVRRSGSDTLLELRADCGANATRPILQTRTNSTADLLTGEASRSRGFLVLSAPATSDKVAMLIQEFMIGGGTLSCAKPATESYTLSGPLPNQTRAGYLNCAGDLFRPEEER